jgi:triosephosphate isomerase
MRKPFIAGNWKMHMTIPEAEKLVQEMLPGLEEVPSVEKAVCPPFVDLPAVASLLKGTTVRLGAQNMHWEEKGAFTGEISPLMLQGLCDYVIVGHSERRKYFGETDETVNLKVKSALAHGLTPIVCVGENLEQKESGLTSKIVRSQIAAGLSGLVPEQVAGIVIAYEPIWAIGTGKAATPEYAERVIREDIRETIAELFGEDAAASVRIQYGGSTKAANIESFMQMPDIDGALVGGASLKASEFVEMVRIAASVKG